MFWSKKTIVVNKKDIVPPHLVDPMQQRKSFRHEKFDRYDIPGEAGKSIRKILFLILALFALWFIYESWLSWDIFQR